MSERFYVAELEGWFDIAVGSTKPGLTVQVLDRRGNLHRVVWLTRRTETLYPSGNNTAVKVKRQRVRAEAAARCAELNAGGHVSLRRRKTRCPWCGFWTWSRSGVCRWCAPVEAAWRRYRP